MTQEEKELLLKDLCARLPYGVKAKIREEGVLSYDSGIGVIVGKEHADNEIFTLQCKNDGWCLTAISEFVPYLRPMSSMTKKEYETFPIPYSFDSFSTWNNTILSKVIEGTQILIGIGEITEIIDWLNAHHFDYRGLIEKGLALEAPEGMYKN